MIKNLWVDEYRPKTISDCILPNELKNKFSSYVAQDSIPNLILNGPSGVGKTTIARAMLDEYGCDYLKINAALKKGVDVIRDEILEFASTVSFAGKKKFVIFDEADGMLHTAQKALNAFIEEFSENCGYIFIVNNSKKLLPELQSRCLTVDFTITKADFPILAKAFYVRLETIFVDNGVEYNKQVVGPIIKRHYPDWRQMLIVFQDYAAEFGAIDTGILGNRNDENYSDLIELLRVKSWEETRKWVGENSHVCVKFADFAGKLIKQIEPKVDVHCWQVMTLIAHEHDFRDYFVTDRQLSTISFLTKLMAEVTWRK